MLSTIVCRLSLISDFLALADIKVYIPIILVLLLIGLTLCQGVFVYHRMLHNVLISSQLLFCMICRIVRVESHWNI